MAKDNDTLIRAGTQQISISFIGKLIVSSQKNKIPKIHLPLIQVWCGAIIAAG